MNNRPNPTKDYPIFVDLKPSPLTSSIEDISNTTPEQLAQKSAKAMEQALGAVQTVARRLSATLNAIADSPDERPLTKVEMTFGLKLDTEANVFITSAGLQATMEVKLTWSKVNEHHTETGGCADSEKQ